jgi:oxysterol-binding protein-related protein 8
LSQTGKKELLFDATHAKATYPTTRPLEEQGDRESQKLWLNTAAAVKKSDHRAATDDKSRIEERQREEAAKRESQGKEWRPQLFRPVQGGPGGSEEGEENLDWILDTNM